MTRSPAPTFSTRTTAPRVDSPAPQPEPEAGPDFVAVPGLIRTAPDRTSSADDPLGGTQPAPQISSALDRLRGTGARLPRHLADPLGDAMGTDFRNVTIHVDAQAQNLTRALQARAFTHGSDIYFGAGAYAPDTGAGRHLLRHELAHVAQGTAGSPPGSGIVVGRADDPAEVQAEAVARDIDRAAALLPSARRQSPPVGPAGDAAGPSPARRLIRRAGAKIAFEAKDVDQPEDKQLVAAIGKAIAAHQSGKRQQKNYMESAKDKEIERITKAEERAVGRIEKGLETEEYQKRREDIQEPAKAEKVEVLKAFHGSYQQSGWRLDKLLAEIDQATQGKVVIGAENNDEIPITSRGSGRHLYSIFRGQRRFNPAMTQEKGQQLVNPVYGKKSTQKQYVRDARGLFIGRFVYRGCYPEQMKQLFTTGWMKPRNDTDIIGKQFERFDFGNRQAGDRITQEEREYLQQRDGSGDDQRMLSVTHAKPTRKVYSNHGEEFTDSATIKIDLAKMNQNLVYDVHLEESHPGKTSLPRKDLNKTAADERILYVYSAEKNRETLLMAIPEIAIVEVKILGLQPMTPYAAKRFYNKEFNQQELDKERKEWEDKQAVERALIEASSKQSAQSAQAARYEKIVTELKLIAKQQAKKFKKSTKALDQLWASPEEYLSEYERTKKPLNPSLIMFSDLEALIKVVEASES